MWQLKPIQQLFQAWKVASATLTTFPGFFNDRENPVDLILFINTQPEYLNIFEAAEPRTCSCEHVCVCVTDCSPHVRVQNGARLRQQPPSGDYEVSGPDSL